jgi:hypothetical protein
MREQYKTILRQFLNGRQMKSILRPLFSFEWKASRLDIRLLISFMEAED